MEIFLRSWAKNFNSSDIAYRKVVFKEPYWQNCHDIFPHIFAFQPYCVLEIKHMVEPCRNYIRRPKLINSASPQWEIWIYLKTPLSVNTLIIWKWDNATPQILSLKTKPRNQTFWLQFDHQMEFQSVDFVCCYNLIMNLLPGFIWQ